MTSRRWNHPATVTQARLGQGRHQDVFRFEFHTAVVRRPAPRCRRCSWWYSRRWSSSRHSLHPPGLGSSRRRSSAGPSRRSWLLDRSRCPLMVRSLLDCAWSSRHVSIACCFDQLSPAVGTDDTLFEWNLSSRADRSQPNASRVVLCPGYLPKYDRLYFTLLMCCDIGDSFNPVLGTIDLRF